MQQDLDTSLEKMLALIPAIEARFLATVAALIFLWLVHRLIQFFITHQTFDDVGTRYQARKTSGYIMMIIGVLLVGRIWFDGFQSIMTLLGLVSVGLVIALKDMLIDLAGWLFILWRQPLKVGDRIQIGELSGDVIDIRMFQFTILEIGNWVSADQSTGRVIHVPNGQVFSQPQANYTQGFQYIWDEMHVTLTFDSNWEKAKEILQAIATRHTGHCVEEAKKRLRKAAERYYIFYSKLTPIVYTSLNEYGIVLSIRFLSEPRRRRGNEQAIWEDILREFAACNDISFAYPTQRFFNPTLEGAARPRSFAESSPPASLHTGKETNATAAPVADRPTSPKTGARQAR